MSTYHADDAVLRAYAQDRLDDLAVWSVEAHLDRCPGCRSRIVLDAGELAPPPIDLPRQGRMRPGTGRRRIGLLLTTGPGTRIAWLLSLAVTILLIVAVAAEDADTAPSWLLLLVAPALPVLGTAASYGPHTDPLHELVAASPYGGLRIILWRTLSVLAVSIPVAIAAGNVSGLGTPAIWLLPSVALTALTLGLASLMEPHRAAAVVAAAWTVLILGTTAGDQPAGGLVTTASGPVWVAVIVAAAALVFVRKDRLQREVNR